MKPKTIRVTIRKYTELSLFYNSFQFLGHLRKIHTGGAFFPRNHEVEGGGEVCLIQAKKFAKDSLQTIAFDRFTHPFAHRDSQSWEG